MTTMTGNSLRIVATISSSDGPSAKRLLTWNTSPPLSLTRPREAFGSVPAHEGAREAARRRFPAHRLRHAVGAEDESRAGRDVGEVLDEDRALGLEVVDDVGVVDDLVAHVDRRAELVQRALDDLDRAIDAGAEAARLGEDDFFEAHRRATRGRRSA